MRRGFVALVLGLFLASGASGPVAAGGQAGGSAVVLTWYRLVLELVRHTATYSPPVASRAFAYIGITAFETLASGDPRLQSLAGQVTDFTPTPPREAGATYDEAVALNAAMTISVEHFFGNTGPSGQQAMQRMAELQRERLIEGVPPDVVARSEAQGRAIAEHVIAWSLADGGTPVENMGFPREYQVDPGPGRWVPTSAIRQQQAPLLPDWGNNRPFAMPAGDACPLPPPPAYSEDPGSAFYIEAKEVYDTSKALTDEQKLIARFWSDDPMLSPTPPGHWISIAMDILAAQNADEARSAEVLALLGIGVADGFIGCWHEKFRYDLVRPITYIRATMDPAWEALLITPPFPEYPSGHSTQSGAAAAVLTQLFGEGFAFDDATHEADGLPVRSFPDFDSAAQEAAMSRLYGGIHFRAAIELGLEQGRCIGGHVNALRTRS